MKVKMWLRGPADNPRVELIGGWGWYWRSGHYSQREERSLMAELLTAREVEELHPENGRWLLPGTPP